MPSSCLLGSMCVKHGAVPGVFYLDVLTKVAIYELSLQKESLEGDKKGSVLAMRMAGQE